MAPETLTEVNPPDLTQLSRKNGGQFPFAEVYRTVDGREMRGSHKRFAMPFWGEYLQNHGQEFAPGQRGGGAKNHRDRSLCGDAAEQIAAPRPIAKGSFS